MQTTPLAPGACAAVVLNGGTLRLQAGTYLFTRLTVNAGSTLALPTSGIVQVFVRDALVYHGAVTGGANLVLGYAGTAETVVDAALRARFVAPNATVTVRQPFTGSLSARNVTIDANAIAQCATIVAPTFETRELPIASAPAAPLLSVPEVSPTTELMATSTSGPAANLPSEPGVTATNVAASPVPAPLATLAPTGASPTSKAAPEESSEPSGGVSCALSVSGRTRNAPGEAGWLGLLGLALLGHRRLRRRAHRG